VTPLARRVVVGLVLVLLLGLGLEYLALAQARQASTGTAARRQALVAARAVADVVAAASGSDETDGQEAALQRTVDRLAASLDGVERIRVIDLGATSLTVSSDPADAAPRRLKRDEKNLYDAGQLLRANDETNRQEGVARKELALVEPLGGGLRQATVPLRSDGDVTGMAVVDVAAREPVPHTAWWHPVVLGLGALALALLAALPLGSNRWGLNAVAAALAIAALAAYGWIGLSTIHADRRTEEETVAARLVAVSADAGKVATAVGLPAGTLQAAGWDADLYGRPRGTVSAAGAIDEAALAADLGQQTSRLVRLVAGLSVLALVLLAFVGLGFASTLGHTLSTHRQAYFYVVPAMIGMLVLVFFPFAYGITLSFTESNLYNTDKPIWDIWVGVDNYVEILTDWKVYENTDEGVVWRYQNFYWTLGFTVLWTVTNVAFGVTVGLFLALILNVKGLALKPFYRVLLILPWAVPNYITALIWRGMFHRQFGVVNQIVQVLGGDAISWFEQPFTSFMAVLATNGWLSFPFMMVVSLGALQSIPSDLYEAARVDGATGWQQFRSITLPSLKPALVPAIILSVIWTFNMFNIIYLTSQGEPAHSTEILITEAYKIAFEQYRYGYAAAYSTVIFLILLAYGAWQNHVTRATESIG